MCKCDEYLVMAICFQLLFLSGFLGFCLLCWIDHPALFAVSRGASFRFSLCFIVYTCARKGSVVICMFSTPLPHEILFGHSFPTGADSMIRYDALL